MSRIAHASGAAAMFVIMVAHLTADALQWPPEHQTCIGVRAAPADAVAHPATPLPKRQRVRSTSKAISKILDQGYDRSPTFRGLVETLEQSPVLVYIEPGRCPAIRRQRLNGCLADLGMAGGARHLRVRVDVALHTDTLIATLGHELQHAVEAGESNAVARPVGANVYETDNAQDAKEAILEDLRRARRECGVTTGAVPPA